MYRGRSFISVLAAAAAVAAAVFAAPVFAQESDWGGDVEDFSAPQRPARLTPEAGGGDADFTAALEAAAAAEGRTTASAESGDTAAKSQEFVPKNEITIIKNPGKADNAAKKKKEKKERTGSGERLKHTMGGRIGVGSEIELGLGLNIGITDVNRLDFGINMGFGLISGKDYEASGFFEAFALYEWRFNISEELSWFAGAGGVIGYHAGWKDTTRLDKDNNPVKTTNNSDVPFGIGLGGRAGIEVDLSFIDPDHALSSLRSSLVSLDVRPMLCIIADRYPLFRMTVGINYTYVFGGGKSKESDKEKSASDKEKSTEKKP